MNNKRKGQKFETKVQKTLNSGSLWFDKGDLKTEDFIIDSKYTEKGSIRITKNMIEKIWNEALESNKFPLLEVGIKDDKWIWFLTIKIDKK